jgi:hypothetical protein
MSPRPRRRPEHAGALHASRPGRRLLAPWPEGRQPEQGIPVEEALQHG